MVMKRVIICVGMALVAAAATAQERGMLTMPWGEVVEYTAYRDIYYVENIEDSTYQRMNIFIPDGADESTPIFMPNGVGGYMAAAPSGVNAGDASGRALAEGYVVAIAGARGRNSTVTRNGETVYTGRAPKGLLDLKAAIRYLRAHDAEYAGNTEFIITDGTSAGGAMSALLGATGNNKAYDAALRAMGAADERDDIFAAVCFCPITDLDHADMAYEWLYQCTNGVTRTLTKEQEEVAAALAAAYPEYLNSLGLTKADGAPLTEENYMDYIKGFIIAAAQEAKDAGADIPDSVGFSFGQAGGVGAPMNGGMPPMREGAPREMGHRPPMPPMGGMMGRGEYITDLDMEKYLNYVVTTIRLKTPPAFDSKGVAGGRASAENEEFGDETGSTANFTAFALQQATGNEEATIDETTAENVRLMNPMKMMDEGSTIAPHWYIRHGARDRDTAFPVPVNLATKLQNKGYDVNFKLPWNRPHSGDYALAELFEWTGRKVKSEK